MTSIESRARRTVVIAGGLACFAPAWLARAFGAQEQGAGASPPVETSARLDAALVHARSRGKPLLVVLVPETGRRLARGRLWGDLFGLASDEALADFVLCEWTCLDFAELEALVAPAKLPEDAVAALIETDVADAKPEIVLFRHEDLSARELGGFPIDELRARATALGERLSKAILPDRKALTRRSAQCELANRSVRSEFMPLLHSALRPRLSAVDAWAAFLREFYTHDVPQLSQLTSWLARACTQRLWEQDLDGARWRVEHVDPCPPCGMASVGMSSRAFLEFYTAPSKR